MSHDDHVKDTLLRLPAADGAPFSVLAGIAGLDPRRSFRHAELSGTDFHGSDLKGYDFSGAVLVGASFKGSILDGSRFDGADVAGVVWPEGWQPEPASAERGSGYSLTPLQAVIAEALTTALERTEERRAVAVLPTGFGVSAILAEVLRSARDADTLRGALVLTETVPEREQLAGALQQLGHPTFSGRHSPGPADPMLDGEIWVETFGNYRRNLQERGEGRVPSSLAQGCSHVVFMSLPHRRREDIGAIADQADPPALLAFTHPLLEKVGADGKLVRERFRAVFSSVTVTCSFQQAVEERAIRPADVVIKSAILDGVRSASGDPEIRGANAAYLVALDFVEEVIRLPGHVSALLVAPDVENVDTLTHELEDALRRDRDPEWTRTVVPLSSRHKRKPIFSRQPGMDGMIVVATIGMLEGFDVRGIGLFGLVGRVPDRLLKRLLFPPWHEVPTRLIDYSDLNKSSYILNGQENGWKIASSSLSQSV